MSTSDPSRDERRRMQGFVALLAVQIFFGLFPVFIKLAGVESQGFEAQAIAAWRMVTASLVLGGLALWREGRAALPRRADLGHFLLCGMLGVAVNQVLFLHGMEHTSVVDAGLLITLIPVFTYAMAVLVRQEVLRGRRMTGILIALGGAVVLVISTAGEGGPASGRLFGNLLIVANCLSYAAYLVIARPLLARYSALAVIAWVFVASLVSLPLVIFRQPLLPQVASPTVWWSLAYILVFPTVLAYLGNTYALARVSASTTAVFIYLQPFVAVIGAWFVFGERLSGEALLAALFLFVGIWLVTTSPALRTRALTREP